MSTKFDFIIVGQGIAGTALHYGLHKEGKKVLVIDQDHKDAASKVAAGIINPITGRKYMKSWRIEDLLPFARSFYAELAEFLSVETYSEAQIFRALYSPKEENIWYSRQADPLASRFINEEADASEYDGKIDGVLSYGGLKGGLQIKLKNIIFGYRKFLAEQDLLLTEKFDHSELETHSDGVTYKGFQAGKIVFAEGYKGQFNPYFDYLPFEPAKGEVLLVRIEGHPFESILRHKMFICPVEDSLYWIGSAYIWDFENGAPTAAEKERLTTELKKILKVPFEIIDHIAAVRPAVRGRKPMIGPHPEHENVYLFNGMGTKGSSLAPYWSDHLKDHLLTNKSLDSEINIKRFEKLFFDQ